MRHLFGIILGIAVTAALFFGGGWGYHRLSTLVNVTNPHLTGTRGLTSLGALAATGLFIGILMAAPRVSPLATALPAVVLLAATALYVASPSRALRLIPMKTTNFGLGAHVLLVTGVYALIGAAMIVPLFVPSRWRKRAAGEDEEAIGMAAASSYLS
ncbi:MAG TPA: hypothetical protein VKD26_05740 [Streptosporangiaceae bacterium]|nr:hypothetical protein [Streptosporangiaceae bacterium]